MSLFNIRRIPAHQSAYTIPILGIIITLGLACNCHASDISSLTNADAPSATLGVALDSEGKPILIPSQNRSAFDYHAEPHFKLQAPAKKKPKKLRRKSTKTLSRKQQLASRSQVANDPSCRWLDSRIDKLEKSLKHRGNQKSYGFHRSELKIRTTEWKCMKCGAEGPSQVDHDRCQYRR